MIEITTVCAILHTPTEIILVGAYQDKYDAFSALGAEIDRQIKTNPKLSHNDFYLDWLNFPIGEDKNYVIADAETVIDRYKKHHIDTEEDES